MNTLKALENRLRGWIPKEASFPSTVTAQVNQKTSRHKLLIVYVTIFAAVFATVFITYVVLEVLSSGHASFGAGAAAGVASFIALVLTIRRNQNPNTSKRRIRQ